jgi:hypothetical protein
MSQVEKVIILGETLFGFLCTPYPYDIKYRIITDILIQADHTFGEFFAS